MRVFIAAVCIMATTIVASLAGGRTLWEPQTRVRPPGPAITGADLATPIGTRVRLLELSDRPTPQQVAPYRDALVVATYRALESGPRVAAGQVIRVTHFALRNGVAQPLDHLRAGAEVRLALRPFDTSPVLQSLPVSDTIVDHLDAPQFHDADQRLDLGALSDQAYGDVPPWKVRTLLMLRGQLRVVAWGDSRAFEGLRMPIINDALGTADIAAYNIACDSVSLEVFSAAVDPYLLRLPALEWVIVGLAPRMLNAKYTSDWPVLFPESSGVRRDRARDAAFWSDPPVVRYTARDLAQTPGLHWRHQPWGDHVDDGVHAGPVPHPHTTVWSFDEAGWARFVADVERLTAAGRQVLIFTPPSHPGYAEAAAIDEDYTPRTAYHDDLLPRLRSLEAGAPGVHFVDVNRAAQHDFPAEMFNDADHLNSRGAEKLTRVLVDRMREAGAFDGAAAD